MADIDQFSVASLPIEMHFREVALAIGTAFTWRRAGQAFLITNWHNVSGRNPHTGVHLSPTAAEPDRVWVWWNVKGQLGSKRRYCHALRDDSGAPLWWIHPVLEAIDVVALPIDAPEDAELFAINDMPQDRISAGVGQDVYIIGFPYGIGVSSFPVWKRGSLASEPEVVDHLTPYVLVDTASKPGMSGSPVVRRSWGGHAMADGSFSVGAGTSTRFFGVYSGRLASADPLDAELGMVWPANLIDEILAGGERDQ